MTVDYDTTIAPGDQMWESGAQWYFDVGLSALDCVRRARVMLPEPVSILDLPCGHGRVCRMLRAAYPSAHITVADLDRSGVDFCAERFNAVPVYSHHEISTLSFDRTYDFIWCGSLFTHLDRHHWHDFLALFTRHLGPDGVLVFTTHGRQPIQWMRNRYFDYGLTNSEQAVLIDGWTRTGFGFVTPANQAFGLSLSSLSWVTAQIEAFPELKLVGMTEAGWAGHQDVFSCLRLRELLPSRPKI